MNGLHISSHLIASHSIEMRLHTHATPEQIESTMNEPCGSSAIRRRRLFLLLLLSSFAVCKSVSMIQLNSEERSTATTASAHLSFRHRAPPKVFHNKSRDDSFGKNCHSCSESRSMLCHQLKVFLNER